jgi:hypothetical protein
MQHISSNSLRKWLIGLFVLIAVCSAILSFVQPWWIADFGRGGYIKIFGWGLRHNLLELGSYVANDVTPQWQIYLAWAYIAISCGLDLLCISFNALIRTIIFSLTGISFIIYPTVAIYKVIAERTAVFGIQLEGRSWVGGDTYVTSSLTHWHYLIYIGGGILLALAVIEVSMLVKSGISNKRRV